MDINNIKLKQNADYFGAEVSYWKSIISGDKFDIVEFFQNRDNDRYFQTFYKKVLGGKEGAYANYSKFIEN
ncbi:hypothetical protein IJ913_01795 [bacterium]|nr:hypothetical protein [bacterium]